MNKYLAWCVFLLCFFAEVNSVLPSFKRSAELQKLVRIIMKDVNETHPDSFNVPVNIKDECMGSALSCFRYQIPKLKEAKGLKKDFLANPITKLKLRKLHDNDACTACSEYSAQGPKVFLENMLQLLQKISSQGTK